MLEYYITYREKVLEEDLGAALIFVGWERPPAVDNQVPVYYNKITATGNPGSGLTHDDMSACCLTSQHICSF